MVGGVLVFGFLAELPLWGSAYALQLATDILTFTVLATPGTSPAVTGYLSFGQVSFYGLGAYTTALIVLHTPAPWYAAVLAAGLASGLAACVLGALMLRLHGILFALGMAGLARIFVVVSDWEFEGDSVGITLPAQVTPGCGLFRDAGAGTRGICSQLVVHAVGLWIGRHKRS